MGLEAAQETEKSCKKVASETPIVNYNTYYTLTNVSNCNFYYSIPATAAKVVEKEDEPLMFVFEKKSVIFKKSILWQKILFETRAFAVFKLAYSISPARLRLVAKKAGSFEKHAISSARKNLSSPET